MNVSNNTILITGGASGIGYALAEAFLVSGNKVIICGRRERKLQEAQSHHPELFIKVCDVSIQEERQELVNWATTKFPELNVLVNNAGIQRDIDITKGADDIIRGEDELKINLEAPIMLSAMFVPYMSGKKNAVIINVSSGLGFIPAARMPVYSATKAGLHAFSMSLRHQLQKVGIEVYEIVPPGLDTDLNAEGRKRRKTPFFGVGPKEFVVSVMNDLKNNVQEIGFGFTADIKKISREELDKRFQNMNRW
ncbi:MAG: SDR family NAD(P)-dependent oxidoreductase [Candidatus Margulisbacteria bacterium]|nr:SDR family NAD(P)-dependent oxidoreductase [Candidatus Margulisiibacteriota bacterium]